MNIAGFLRAPRTFRTGTAALAVAMAAFAFAAPSALAATSALSPADGAQFTARSFYPVTFRASSTDSPGNYSMWGRISRSPTTEADGLIGDDVAFFEMPKQGTTTTYQGTPTSADAVWRTPGTYYWQAASVSCGSGVPEPCATSAPQRFVVVPVEPPHISAPADGAVIPYHGTVTITVRDALGWSYDRDASGLFVEFSPATRLDPDGTFADADAFGPSSPLLSAGGDGTTYEATLGYPWTTYYAGSRLYWHAYRYDCSAEPDCIVTDGQIRSVTIAPKPTPLASVPSPPSAAPSPTPTTGRPHRDGRAPKVTARAARVLAARHRVRFRLSCNERCSMRVSASLRVPHHQYRLSPHIRKTSRSAKPRTFSFSVSRRLRRSIREAGPHQRASVVIKVTVADGAGNHRHYVLHRRLR